MKKIGVSQKAVVFNEEGRFLVLHRTSFAPFNSNEWYFPGGNLEFGEDAAKGIIREIKEESGLEVNDLKPFDAESHINKEGDFWVTIAYTAKAISKLKLSPIKSRLVSSTMNLSGLPPKIFSI
jgi:ADP-ribose pyrophosphatase YjhB (NUDIX family)